MKRILMTILAVVALLSASAMVAQAGNPHGQPPGNDGDLCHGANQETCRPDPQPSHGAECDPHGNNPDGNDDHCADPTEAPPSTQPSDSPTSEPSDIPSDAPSADPSLTAPPSSSPTRGARTSAPSQPNTATDASGTAPSQPISWTFLFLASILSWAMLALSPKRSR